MTDGAGIKILFEFSSSLFPYSQDKKCLSFFILFYINIIGRLQAMANQQNDEPPPDDSPNVFVEKLQTAWSGICYKIQLDLHTLHGRPFFGLYFQGSLPKEDIPIPEIFITSKANADGIVGYRWNNGEELKFNLEG